MGKVYETGDCDKIKTSFDLSNNNGFIPLFTRVFLDLQNGTQPDNPIFKTPMHLTDASIPITSPFSHSNGLLYFETYVSYQSINNLPQEEIEKRAKDLKFSYKIYDCNGGEQEFNKYDLGPYIIKSKELIYFVTLIDLI